MTTIIAEPTTSTADVLRSAATGLQALPYHRVGRIEVHQMLLNAGSTWQQSQDALAELHDRLPAGHGLNKWTWRANRDDAAALLRLVADIIEQPANGVAAVLRAASRHVNHPVNASLADALTTVTRDPVLADQAVNALARQLCRRPRDLPMWDRLHGRSHVAAVLADVALLTERDAAAVTR